MNAKHALKEAGLKITIPRVKILQLLFNSHPRHLSAEEIVRALSKRQEEMSLATVYRVLTLFVEKNLVIRHNFENGFSIFEFNCGDHHDHIICVKCTDVVEFKDKEIERRQEVIAKQNGFKILNHTLTMYGLCPACQK